MKNEPHDNAAVPIWQAPLVPAVLAVALGIVADRSLSIPLPISLMAVAACIAGWMTARVARAAVLALVCLGLAIVSIGAAYHHWWRDCPAGDDIGNLASDAPQIVHVRG